MEGKIQELSSEVDIRKQKIIELIENNQNPYKEKFDRTHKIIEARGLKEGAKVKVAGRIVFKRVMGKFSFIKIQDIEASIQVSVSVNELEEKEYSFYKKMVDIGDFVGVEGEIYITKTSELTVRADKLTLLSKALRPLPEKFHGLTDIEARYRQRYLDLISNKNVAETMLGRSKFVTLVRKILNDNGFIEVETPILQSYVSGASAKPFYTKHNALDKMCNLRIAPETYLKQVISGGFDRVYEVAKNFRNEGMDTQHLQEFTMVEWYASYWNFENNIKFFHDFITSILMEIKGTTKIEYQGIELDFGCEWKKLNYVDELNKILGFDVLEYDNVEDMIKAVEKTNIIDIKEFNGIKTVGGIIDLIYKRKIRANLIQPTILYNYPTCLSPLARRRDDDSRVIDKFQVVVAGSEICNAYSELVNPIIQRQALEEQARAKLAGDDEAMEFDEDFVLAVEHGMPPISGLGFGIDRFMTILYNQSSVRDVVLFPLMK
jgi:lysyl-tRNA synthetase class 2